MSRLVRMASLLVLVLILGGVGLWATQAAAPPAVVGLAPAPKKKEETPRLRDRDFRAALGKVYDFKGINDPTTTLGQALKLFADRNKVVFSVNERAFHVEKVEEVGKILVVEKAPLEPMKAPLAAVLKKLLARIPDQSGAYFVIRRDAIEITSGRALRQELRLPYGEEYALNELVWEEIHDERLEDALQRVAEAGDVTVYLDPGAREKAAVKLTTTLRNLPAALALKVLADLGGLAVAVKGNAYYVTTPENVSRSKLVRFRERNLREKLARVIDFKGFDDPKLTLGEALTQMADHYDIPLYVNERAFRVAKVKDVRKTFITEKEPIPPMNKATLSAVLKKILSRLQVPYGATYLLRGDGVEITTVGAVRHELKLAKLPKLEDEEESLETLPGVVWEEFGDQTLDAVLRQIADDYDATIVIDSRAKTKAATKVTATLRNVSIDRAVEMLADAADLAVVVKENTYYVTTPENAERLGKRKDRK